jgi:hypothetical protein
VDFSDLAFTGSVNAMVCEFLTIDRKVRLSARELNGDSPRRSSMRTAMFCTEEFDSMHTTLGFSLHGLRLGSTRVLWSRANKKYGEKEANADALLKQEWNGGSGWEFCPTTITSGYTSSSSTSFTG